MVAKQEIIQVIADVLDLDHADLSEDVLLEQLPEWDCRCRPDFGQSRV